MFYNLIIMKQDQFIKSQIPPDMIPKVLEACSSSDFGGKVVFRLLPEKNEHAISYCDFLPTFLSTNKYQSGDVGSYGMSVYSSEEHIINAVKTIRPLQKKYHSLAKGVINNARECYDDETPKGHINCFLFDPINNNPVLDFQYYKVGSWEN